MFAVLLQLTFGPCLLVDECFDCGWFYIIYRGVPMGPDSPPALLLSKVPFGVFGATITIEVTLTRDSVTVMIDDNVVGDNVYKNLLVLEEGQPLPDR